MKSVKKVHNFISHARKYRTLYIKISKTWIFDIIVYTFLIKQVNYTLIFYKKRHLDPYKSKSNFRFGAKIYSGL